jgi:hypothetical protein
LITVVVLGLVTVRLVLVVLGIPAVRGWLHIGLPTCAAAQISTSVAAEGKCAVGAGLFGGGTTVAVVDSGHVLRMPGYDAELLATSVIPFRVSNPESHPAAYPDGHGLLVSFFISVVNTSARPITFDAGGHDTNLLIDYFGTAGRMWSMPELPNAPGEPGTSIADAGPIAPRSEVGGWVSFVAPIWARSVLHSRAADLRLFPAGHTAENYVGVIRLWKWATTNGEAAAGLTPSLSLLARSQRELLLAVRPLGRPSAFPSSIPGQGSAGG